MNVQLIALKMGSLSIFRKENMKLKRFPKLVM